MLLINIKLEMKNFEDLLKESGDDDHVNNAFSSLGKL